VHSDEAAVFGYAINPIVDHLTNVCRRGSPDLPHFVPDSSTIKVVEPIPCILKDFAEQRRCARFESSGSGDIFVPKIPN
jgi:hypothetical protein